MNFFLQNILQIQGAHEELGVRVPAGEGKYSVRTHIIRVLKKYQILSEDERQRQMAALRLQAMIATDPREGIKAVEALGAYGNDALPKLVSIGDAASVADKNVRQAANSEIEKIKKGLKP